MMELKAKLSFLSSRAERSGVEGPPSTDGDVRSLACHSERSEEPPVGGQNLLLRSREILRFAQDDNGVGRSFAAEHAQDDSEGMTCGASVP